LFSIEVEFACTGCPEVTAQLAAEYRIQFLETSAKNAINVDKG
jgi:hypothetical protein